MKEITRIITAQVTMVEKMTDEDADQLLAYKEKAEKNVTETLRNLYDAHDVNVQIQDFVADVGDKGAE